MEQNYNNIIVDADAIICKACYTLETIFYTVVDSSNKEVIVYTSKKDADDYIKRHQGKDAYTIVKDKRSEPLYIVFKIMDNLIEEIRTTLQCDEYTLFVGDPQGTPTFRHKLAKTAPYKGNRKKEDRPIHLKAAKEYLISKYNAQYEAGLEAEDLVGIELCKPGSNAIAAHIDKDLDMLPGWHYNIATKRVYYGEDPGTLELTSNRKKLLGTGMKWMFAQALLGDTIDNIKGITGYGPVKVFEQLNPLCTILEVYEFVKKVYEHHDRDLEESLDLLWILRERNTTWRDYIK